MQQRIVSHGEAKMVNPFSKLDLEISVVKSWEMKLRIQEIAERELVDIRTVIDILKRRVFLTRKGRPYTLRYRDLCAPSLFTNEALAMLTGIGRTTIDQLKRREGIRSPPKKELGHEEAMGKKIDVLMKLQQGESQSAIATLYECDRRGIHVIALDALDAGFKIPLPRNASRKPKGHNLVMQALYMLSTGESIGSVARALNVCASKVALLRSIAIDKGFLEQ